MNLWFALAALASPAFGAPVEVASGTEAMACPDRVAVQRALSAQIGDGAPAPGWRLIYQGTADPSAGGRGRRGALRLELADERGQARLRRQLRVDGGDCRAQAEAIALIVYRFFAELGDSDGEPLPSPSPVSPPPVRARPSASPRPAPPPRPPPPAVRVATAAARPPTRLRLSIEGGAGLWTRRPGTATSAVGLRVAWSNVEAALSILAPRAPAVKRPPDGGEVEVSALGMAMSLGLAREGPRLRLHGGPLALVARESARARGIAIPGENTGTTGALGLAAGASGRLSGGFRLGLEAGLVRAVLGNRFVVGGWGQVLPPPAWQSVVLARLGYTFSP